MKIEEVVEILNANPKKGLQLTKLKGVLSSTWVVYQKRNHYYYFDVCEKFVFDIQHRYTFDELVSEFKGCTYKIDTDVL